MTVETRSESSPRVHPSLPSPPSTPTLVYYVSRYQMAERGKRYWRAPGVWFVVQEKSG